MCIVYYKNKTPILIGEYKNCIYCNTPTLALIY